jgi:hypothetical protein
VGKIADLIFDPGDSLGDLAVLGYVQLVVIDRRLAFGNTYRFCLEGAEEMSDGNKSNNMHFDLINIID